MGRWVVKCSNDCLLWQGTYPHALHSAHGSERPQSPKCSHSFECLNTTSPTKRGYEVYKRHLPINKKQTCTLLKAQSVASHLLNTSSICRLCRPGNCSLFTADRIGQTTYRTTYIDFRKHKALCVRV